MTCKLADPVKTKTQGKIEMFTTLDDGTEVISDILPYVAEDLLNEHGYTIKNDKEEFDICVNETPIRFSSRDFIGADDGGKNKHK